MLRKLLFCLTFWCFYLQIQAQGSSLNPGDIAIIAFQSDNNDQFAFLTLVDMAPTTQIHFSEKGWNGALATPAFVTSTEGVHTWTSPATVLPMGTVITVNFNSLGTAPSANYGTVSSTSAAKLSTSGDELIAFQGGATSPNFIYAFGSRPWLATGTPTSNQSWLPSSLVNGITARDFATENDDQYFNLTNNSGPKELILAAIGNTKNWTRSNTRFASLPDWHFQITQHFYLQATGDVLKLENWGNNSNGSGNKPDSFTGSGKVFHLANRSGIVDLTDLWKLEKLQIEKGISLSLHGFRLDVNEFTDSSQGLIIGSENASLVIRGKSMPPRFDSSAAILNYLELCAGANSSLSQALQIVCSSKKGGVLLGDSAVLSTNGNLILSSNEKGSAMIQTMGNGARIIGKMEVQKYIPAGRRGYRFMSHPFANSIALSQLTTDIDITGSGGAANGFTTTVTNNSSAFWYNPLLGDGSASDPGWMAFTKTNGLANNAWLNAQGIRINIRGKKGEGLDGKPYTASSVTLHLKDSINTGLQKVVLTKNATNAGFNLIGNPFAADIDMSKLQTGTNILPNYYLWDPYLGTLGGYAGYPFSTSIILPGFAAFFAQTSNAISGNEIQFPEASKVNSNSPIRVLGINEKQNNQLAISIESDSIIWDRHQIVFHANFSDSIHQIDAKKLMNPELNFYSISAEKQKLCIDHRNILTTTKVPIGLSTSLEKKFNLVVNQFPDLPGYDLLLVDRLENKQVLLKAAASYDFQTSHQSNDSARFEIQLISKNIVPVNLNVEKLSCAIFPNPSENLVFVRIRSPKLLPLQISISNTVGQMILQKKLTPQLDLTETISLSKMSAGVYWISISNTEETIVQKIIKN